MSSYIFVYGTLQRGFKQHKLLKDYAIFLNKAYLFGKLYEVQNYPALKLGAKKRVYGEVYKIKRGKEYNLLKLLDEYEECSKNFKKPYEYKRVKAKVYLPNKKYLKAWVYEYNWSIKSLKPIKCGEYKIN